MKKIFIFGVLLFLKASLVASVDSNIYALRLVDNFLRYITQRSFVFDYKDSIHNDTSNLVEATGSMKNLFEEAQNIVNIPEDRKLPVLGFNEFYHGNFNYASSKESGAITGAHFIAVNNDLTNSNNFFSSKLYGFSKALALHESTHAKYNDPTIKAMMINNSFFSYFLIFVLAIIALVLILLVISKKKFKIRFFLLALLCFISSLLIFGKSIIYRIDDSIFNWYEKFTEQRADINALSHLQCYECAKEVAYGSFFATEETEKNLGYLSCKRMKEFAKKYKKEGKCCEAHRNIKDRKILKFKQQDGTLKEVKVLTLEQVQL